MKEQNYLDHLVGVFGQPVAENPGAVIQDAAFKAMGLERWHFLTIDVDKDKLEDAIRGLKAFKMRGINCTIPHKIEVMQYLKTRTSWSMQPPSAFIRMWTLFPTLTWTPSGRPCSCRMSFRTPQNPL